MSVTICQICHRPHDGKYGIDIKQFSMDQHQSGLAKNIHISIKILD